MTMKWLQGTGSVGSGNLGFIDFNNLPSEYPHLQIRYSVRDIGAFTTRGLFMEFNFNGTGYDEHYLKGDGANATSQNYLGLTRFDWGEIPAASALSNTFSSGVIDIYDANSTTKNKTVKIFHGYDLNGSGHINLFSGVWKNNAAITNIRVYPNNAFAQNSRLDLYGFTTSRLQGG